MLVLHVIMPESPLKCSMNGALSAPDTQLWCNERERKRANDMKKDKAKRDGRRKHNREREREREREIDRETNEIGVERGGGKREKRAERRSEGSESQEAREGTIIEYPPCFCARPVHAAF